MQKMRRITDEFDFIPYFFCGFEDRTGLASPTIALVAPTVSIGDRGGRVDWESRSGHGVLSVTPQIATPLHHFGIDHFKLCSPVAIPIKLFE